MNPATKDTEDLIYTACVPSGYESWDAHQVATGLEDFQHTEPEYHAIGYPE